MIRHRRDRRAELAAHLLGLAVGTAVIIGLIAPAISVVRSLLD